ncbi:TetR/AcrR family transcriptional regulator [Vibrio splendidus]|uniref:TetR/AcrR family transcriptional regulator n=1 Tax=Vibrio splendidus TaxID=29497 RepID=UPI001FB3BB28|nr:TetR/AcrR family transcriptional regulator [Vibrio splendidus]UOE81524.1 TetR/AcrR family transcriptional regulator [Vibrio splendidus]
MLREQIAASLEVAFSQQGFAEPSVAQLKTTCNVSLRTLYKNFPSKEAMIVGALEHRHQRYLSLLLEDSPRSGYQAITHIFNKLQQWMEEYAPHGCLSMNALAAFPDNELINQAVIEHKKEVQALMAKQSQRDDLASELFLLHEGVSSAWPVLGKEAVASAQNMVTKLLKETV